MTTVIHVLVTTQLSTGEARELLHPGSFRSQLAEKIVEKIQDMLKDKLKEMVEEQLHVPDALNDLISDAVFYANLFEPETKQEIAAAADNYAHGPDHFSTRIKQGEPVYTVVQYDVPLIPGVPVQVRSISAHFNVFP